MIFKDLKDEIRKNQFQLPIIMGEIKQSAYIKNVKESKIEHPSIKHNTPNHMFRRNTYKPLF
jgi:hypothetical protein